MSETIELKYIDIKDVEPGFYWAKSKDYKWFNLIVEVYGEHPFLRIRAWNRTSDTIVKMDPDDIFDLVQIPKPNKK